MISLVISYNINGNNNNQTLIDMEKKWTKEMVNDFVESRGGCGFMLLGYFPYKSETLTRLTNAVNDLTLTDSEVADMCIDAAYSEIG